MEYLDLIAPPLLGAVIGYSTNSLAIRMLFRPLKPWRLFGLHIPLTPGVIPAKRHELAENIGAMVGDHLLTSEEVARGVASPRFQEDLSRLINTKLESFFDQEFGPIITAVPPRFQGYLAAGVKVLRWRFSKHIRAFLDSETFAETVRREARQQLDDLGRYKGSELISRSAQASIHAAVRTALDRVAQDPALQETLTRFLEERWTGFLERDGRLCDILPHGLDQLLLSLLDRQVPRLLAGLAETAQQPEVRATLASKVSEALFRMVQQLGPLASFLSGFLPQDKLEEHLGRFFAEKGDELGDWLLQPEVQERAASLVRARAEEFLSRPVREHLAELDPETVRQGVRSLSCWMAKGITSRRGLTVIADAMETMLAQELDRPVADVLRRFTGGEGHRNVADKAALLVTDWLRSRQAKRLIDQLVKELVETRVLSLPVGKLGDLLPRPVQEGIAQHLLAQVNRILVQEVVILVDALDIREMVRRKIDSLDILRLESLLLSIMQEQFTAINLVGGLLGFLIGLVNVLFLL